MLGQRELTPEDYIAILRRRWPLIAVLTVLGGILGYGITPLLPKKYTSKTLVLVQQPAVGPDYVRPVVTQDTNQRLASMQQEILSRTRLASIVERVGLFREDQGAGMDKLVGRLRDAIEVTPVAPMAQTGRGQLPGFTISVTFPEPKLAQQICATVTSMFTEANLKLRQQQAEQTTEFLGKQLEEAKSRLDEQDGKLATFQRRNLGSLPGDEQGNLNLLTNLTAQLDATTQTLSRAQQDKTYAEAMLDQQMVAVRATPDGPSPETYDQQLAGLQAQLTSLKSRYTDSHPDVVKLKNSIDALKRKMAEVPKQTESAEAEEVSAPLAESAAIRSLKTQVFQLEQTIKEKTAEQRDLQQRIKLYQTRVESSPAIIQEYKALTRDYQTAVDSYNDLLRKREQSELATALERRQQGEQFQVLDPANLPTVPSFPDKTLFSLGGLGGGIVLGVGLVLLLEVRDQSFRSERDVEALLHIPVLAVVSSVKANADRKSCKPVELAAGA